MFLIVCLCIVWFIAIIWLAVQAMDRLYDERAIGWLLAVCALVVFALPFGLFMPNPFTETETRLCLRGHQEYVTSYRPAMLAGKVFIPGGNVTRKTWICDAWQ